MDLVGLKKGSREPARFFLPFCSFPCEEVARRLYLSSKHQALTRHWSTGDFLSRSERNKFVFYKLPSLQYLLQYHKQNNIIQTFLPNFFSLLATPFDMPIGNAQKFQFFYVLANTLITAFIMSVTIAFSFTFP